MNVPFCLPYINNDIVEEVIDTLMNTGWLTTGPKVARFETKLAEYFGVDKVLAVNSWNSGTTLMLKWWGLEEGDEVIIPAYTYAATALAPMNLGAHVKMVDVGEDFNINVEEIRKAISPKTKAIIPVDIGGRPCDYSALNALVNEASIKDLFSPANENQKQLGRILIVADAAHSIGARYKGKMSGSLTDISVFSFHSVKNVTTGEGGAVALNLPEPFNNEEVYQYLKHLYLYGQTKSAFAKNKGSWKYDIVSEGIKANMSDVLASIGLAQLEMYESKLLPDRHRIFTLYNRGFEDCDWIVTPKLKTEDFHSSAHLYMIRIPEFSEVERDEFIAYLKEANVGTSVHYLPMASFTFFKGRGYNIEDYPITKQLSQNEISLPIYNGLSDDQIRYVIKEVKKAYERVKNN